MERINEYSRTTGRKLSVKFAFENEKDKLNVFVQHLPRSDYTTDDLMELFKPFGVITSAKLLDSMKGPTGIGFVRFSSPTEAEKAIKMMNKKNLCLGENTKAVTCKLADKADAQRRNLTTSELTRNKFPFNQGQNQAATGVIPQPLHASTLPAGHIAALAQSGSLPAHVLPSLPAFSFEVPGFASHSVAPSTMNSGALKTLPTAVPSNRFPNTGAPSVMFHTGNPLSTPGAQSDSQLNPLPPNVHYALSYGQQPQQTIAPGGTTTMSPQLVWLAPTYPNSATSSMFQNYGLTPAPFHSSTLDQTKVTHESQRSTPGLSSHANYPIDRTSIPTGATNTLTTMFQNLTVNGPLETSRFSADSMVSNEQSRTWSYPKNPKTSVDESISNNDQRSAIKQSIPVSHAFENSDSAFVDPVACDASDFIASSMPTSLASLNHSKHGACFGVVNSSSAEIFPSVETNTTSTNDYEIFSEKTTFNSRNGGGAVLDVNNSAPNGFQTDRIKGNEAEAIVDQKVGSQSDSDCVVTTPVSKPDADLMESSLALSATTSCSVKSSS
ncbi:unnamed protein product [Echinostoma caproni]|uniref:RRM domain-containing protein n=1 Tax=Echinostoma caproni TaxID=27848 RepID=A0A3P8HPU7_9TREM|nr:unnamed protein product [Echinostoma caproni]